MSESESWKVIKLWAESMLTSSFDSITDLASYISKNNLNSPSSIQSRQMLQKKLLQREQKEKKKMIVSIGRLHHSKLFYL
jgi:dihydroneopterin aldolase